MDSFTGTLEHKAYNYFVWMPEELSKNYKQKGYIQIKGTVNGFEFRGYLAPRKPNRHVLYLDADIRKKANIKTGEAVNAAIEFDPESRDIPIPDDVELILKETPGNWEKFIAMSDSKRNSILKYILEVKSEDARLRRIEMLLLRLNK